MVSNSIIRQENDFNRLEIMEALYIKYTKPEINLQTTGMGRTLRLLGDKDLCHTTNSHIWHPALAVTTLNSPALSLLPTARCVGYTDLVASSGAYSTATTIDSSSFLSSDIAGHYTLFYFYFIL